LTSSSPSRTPLHDLHTELGGRLVDFAGWHLPIQYEGVIAEHNWTRSSAGLFDVSHMGVVEIWGDDPGTSLERLTPAGIDTLAEGRQRYGLLTNDAGGVIDDFMVANWGTHLSIVVNASRAGVDIAHLRAGLTDCEIRVRPDLALLAVQGPKAGEVIERLDPDLRGTIFLDVRTATIDGIDVAASRCGYTGEDGFELTVPADGAEQLARRLLAEPEVRPAGLGARDTLRLEAGLHLYGNDLDETISPIEADLAWTIPKRRREAADFPGAERILAEYQGGASRIRVGLKPDGRRPVREHTELRSLDGDSIGLVSSGGYGPTVEHPIAMAFVPPAFAMLGTTVVADVRGAEVPCTVVDLPFVSPRYVRS
jgi:aminomethyltransferase